MQHNCYLCEIDTVEIKDTYLSVYKKKLAEEILENYNGVLQRILLGLLDGMCNLHFVKLY